MLDVKRRVPKYADAAHELLSIDEVHDRYDGEWILLQVAQTDDHDRVTQGYVLAHTHSSRLITKALVKALTDDPKVRLAEFIGGTRYLSPDEIKQRLAELIDKPYVNAHW